MAIITRDNRRAQRNCSTVPFVSRRPRRFVYLRQPPEKVRPHCTARTGPRRPRPAEDPRTRPATPRRLRTVTEYSFRGLFTLEGTLFRGLTDQGFKAWPVEGSTGTPDRQSQGLHGYVVQATLERGVRDILRSVQGQSRVPSWGIPSRECIEPSDPIDRVRAPPRKPLRALYVTCPRTASRPLSNGARMST